jgi:hypothetical protein
MRVVRRLNQLDDEIERCDEKLHALAPISDSGHGWTRWQAAQPPNPRSLRIEIDYQISDMVQNPVSRLERPRYRAVFPERGDEFIANARRIKSKLDIDTDTWIGKFLRPASDPKQKRKMIAAGIHTADDNTHMVKVQIALAA